MALGCLPEDQRNATRAPEVAPCPWLHALALACAAPGEESHSWVQVLAPAAQGKQPCSSLQPLAGAAPAEESHSLLPMLARAALVEQPRSPLPVLAGAAPTEEPHSWLQVLARGEQPHSCLPEHVRLQARLTQTALFEYCHYSSPLEDASLCLVAYLAPWEDPRLHHFLDL